METPGKVDFHPLTTLSRFKQVDKVKVSDVILRVEVSSSFVAFYKGKSLYTAISISDLYQRWVTIDGKLHYIQRINHWMGSTKCNYVKAEIDEVVR